MSTVPSARTAAPYLGSLVVSSLVDGLLRHRLFVDLDHVPRLAVGMVQLDLAALGLLYRVSLGLFWAWFVLGILPGLWRGRCPARRGLRLFGLLATLQFLVNLVVINVAIVEANVNSYELLLEAIGLYVVIGLIFVFWYWYLDYPLRDQATPIPPGLLFPEEAYEGLAFGTAGWTPGFIDYLFFAMVASNTFGAPEGHGVLGARLKLAHLVHSLFMTGIFIVIVARAINTLS
ncbi:MAG: hypothetical protein KGQ81_04035 [Cyanobacteria bacterium REEB498]|nr:hypothetical protein [Cyanobacteria bacterium REEB498]